MEQPLTIAGMTPADLPEVHRLETACFTAPWSLEAYAEEVTNPTAYYLVARRGDALLGFGGIWIVDDDAHIVTLAVRDDARRQGVGRRLMEGLLAEARRRGVRSVTLEVRVGNHAARELYGSLGFTVLAYRRRYYPDNGEDAAVMLLTLAPERQATDCPPSQ